jgi:hypothetical protein
MQADGGQEGAVQGVGHVMGPGRALIQSCQSCRPRPNQIQSCQQILPTCQQYLMFLPEQYLLISHLLIEGHFSLCEASL